MRISPFRSPVVRVLCALTSAGALLLGCVEEEPAARWNAGGAGGAGGAGESGGGGPTQSPSAGGGGAAAETCTATFRWLQKDAYRETAGRSSPLWPPHTTTTLEIACAGVVIHSVFRANHGTEPGETDANGEVFLVEVAAAEAMGPRSELDALAAAYEGCECGTEFLSLDALNEAAIQELIEALGDYALEHLLCTGAASTVELVEMLRQGDIESVLAELPQCTWEGGSDWQGGFDVALQRLAADAGRALEDYHVCNNDAELQASLFDHYRSRGEVRACDGSAGLCRGPQWLYVPEP